VTVRKVECKRKNEKHFRMEKISWNDHVKNEGVLQRVKESCRYNVKITTCFGLYRGHHQVLRISMYIATLPDDEISTSNYPFP